VESRGRAPSQGGHWAEPPEAESFSVLGCPKEMKNVLPFYDLFIIQQKCQAAYSGWPKIGTILLYGLTLPNINRFSNLLHDQNQEKICNNTITKERSHYTSSVWWDL